MDTLAQTHQSTLLSSSICFLEIEPEQTGLFCWIAPRVSVLLEALPDELEHTNTRGRALVSPAPLLLSGEADLKVSSLLVEAGKCEMTLEKPVKRLSGGFSTLFISHRLCWWVLSVRLSHYEDYFPN